MNKLLKNIHVFIFIYALVETYFAYNVSRTLITSEETTYNSALVRLKSKKNKLKTIKKYKLQLIKSKQDFLLMGKKLKEVQEKLPSKFDDRSNIKFLKSIAKKVNIKKIYFKTGQIENKGYYSVSNLMVNFKNITFLQLLVFLENIGNSEKLYNLGNLILKNNKVNAKGRYQLISAKLQVQSYRRNLSL